MANTKLLQLGLAALMLALGGTAVATAQNLSAGPDASDAEAPLVRAESRGDRDGGRHGGRHDHGGFALGHRGGSEIVVTLFGEVDADADGAVTQDEVDAWRAAKLAEIDASGDGALSIEEFDTLYREMTRSRMVDAFQNLDADGDGVIGAGEMDSRIGDIVDRMDRDDDGALTIQDRGRRG